MGLAIQITFKPGNLPALRRAGLDKLAEKLEKEFSQGKKQISSKTNLEDESNCTDKKGA